MSSTKASFPRIIALHGFLGEPRDFLGLALPNLLTVDLFRLSPAPLRSWARRFNQQQIKNSILLGYSMGARLALHCLIDDPTKYKAAIILAAHPGLGDISLRQGRYTNDLIWAHKLRTMPWDHFLAEWNGQEIFHNSAQPHRPGENFCGYTLSQYLRHCSLGLQEDLREQISNLLLPILWLCPEQEQSRIEGLKLRHELSQIQIVRGGHRFMFEHPEPITKIINRFLLALIER